MMSSNMPILWQNALMQFRTEIAKKAWVWFAETRSRDRMCYDADKYAKEVEKLVISTHPLLEKSAEVLENQNGIVIPFEALDDLTKFMLKRHVNWRLGSNVNPPFLGSD